MTVIDDGGTGGGGIDTVTRTFSVTVTDVNDPPVGVDDALSTIAEASGVVTIPFATLLGNDSTGPADESGQTLTITAVDNPVGGTVSFSGSDVLFTPAADFNGTASFVYTLRDDGTSNGTPDFRTGTGTVSFTISEVNDPPVGVDDLLSSVAEDSGTRTLAFSTLLANDSRGPNESGQTLTITAVGNSVGGTVSISGSHVTLILTPKPNANGQTTIKLDASNELATTTIQFELLVISENDAPIVSGTVPTLRATTNAPFQSSPATEIFADVDVGDTLSYTATMASGESLPAWLSIDPVTGVLFGMPKYADFGSYTLRWTSHDSGQPSLEASADVSLVVAYPGHAWQHQPDPLDVNDDGQVLPIDALLVINELNHPTNSELTGALPVPPPGPIPAFVDTTWPLKRELVRRPRNRRISSLWKWAMA